MKKFVIYTLILFALVASVEFYNAESVEYIIEDVHDIDWNQLSVGDAVSIPMQQLDRWDDYKISDSSLESGKVKYLADEGKVLIDSTISGDGEIESKFEIDLSDEILVGISLEEKAASPNSIILSTGGLIEVSMRPDYLRHNESAQWGGVNTDESVWYFEQTGNTRGYLKYKINGANKGSSLYINDSIMRNTFTIHSLPGADQFDFAYCTMPEDDTSNNCFSENAKNVKKRSIVQDYIHMNNNFLTMVLNGGTNNDLIINNIKILAKIKSYSNIKIDNSAYFVETGTSLKEVHDKINPKYYEIINNEVTHIASDLTLEDLIDDGGYNSNVPGTYTFKYSHLNGYAEGARTNTTVDVVVMDESEIIDLTANNYTTTITNAPTTKSQIKAMMGVKAIQGDEDLTESVKVSSYGGYDLANPQIGNYNVIFSVENSYGQKLYQNAWLKIVNDSNVENVSIDTQLIYDQSGDSKVSIDENVSYQVTITNNSNVYLNNALIEYDVNKNYFDLDTIANIEATDNVQVKMNDSIKKLDISFNSFEVGEQAVITFDVKALDNWYIYSENQELDHFMNYATLFYYDESVDYEFITELEETAFGGFVNGFSLTDKSGDNLITENEEVYVEHTFYNDSIYSLFTVEFNNEETVDKLTQDYAVDLNVESDKRELVEGIDYDVVGEEQIFIDEVVPSERITVSYTVLSTATFHNPGKLKMNVQSNIWIENRSALYSSEKLKDSIPLDLEKLVNYDISTKLKDSNDGFAAPNELIILEIDVKNTGLIDSNDNVITIDLEDINIVEDILSESMISVETSSSKAAKTAKVAGKGKFTLVDNQITINSISAGSSVKILVGLTVESIIDISNFNLQLDEKPVITESVNIKSNIYDEQSYEPEIEIDVMGNSSINEDLTFEESIGDGDGIIDPGEQFTLKLDLVNDGQVNLDHLLVDLDIDKNLAVSEYDVVPKYYVDDVVSEDYTITMVDGKKQIELTKFPVGQKSTIEITIVYGDSVSNQISKNEIHLTHKYLETIDIYGNLEVDLNNNRNINVDVVTDKVSVKPGDKVSYAIEIANDGLTTEENIIVKYNVDNKNILINNIQNLMIVDSQNNVLTRNEDYIVTNDYITINRLEMSEKYTLTFDLSIANPMYIDYLLGEDYTIKSSVLTKFNFGLDFTNELEFTPDLSDYTITPDATFKTVNGDSVVRPKDFVEFKFTLENNMPVKLTNFKLQIDASDLALINFKVEVDSEDENLQYDVDNNQISFNALPSGEEITITATGQVTADFDTSETLDIKYDYSADFIESSSETLSIYKEIESYTSAALESSLISTSSGNMLVGPDEDLFIDLHLINTGLADIEHLSLEFSESSDFIESLELIEIEDETGKKLDASEYTFNKVIDSNTYMLDIDYMYVYKDYTIKLKASTLSDLEYQPNLEFVTTLSAKYIDEEERTQLQLDSNLLGQVGLEYNMTHNDSDGDNLLDPSETITFNVVLDNYGSVSYHELIIREITNDSNLSEVISDLSVTQIDEFGVESSYGDYTQTDNYLVIDELVAHNKISVNYTLTAKEYFVKQEKVTSLIEVEFSELAGIAPIFTLSNDLKIDYKGNSSINTSATIANSNGMTSVLTGDTIEMNYNIENTGSTVLSDILIVTEYDDNINIDSVKIKSATIDDSNASSQLNLESGQITLDQLNPGEKAIITLEAKMLDKFDNSNLVTNEIKIRPIASVDKYVENTASINIDRSKLEQPKVTIENYEILYDDGDKLLDPNENVAVLIKVENQNDMAINNIVVDYSNYSNNYLSLSASSDSAIVNEAEKTIEKSMLKAKSSFTVELNAETKSKFNSDKFASIQNLISSEEFNDDQVDFNLEIDLDDNTSVETEMTLTDATLDNYASAGEIITIDYSLSNVGNRDLSNLLISDITTDKNINESITNIKLYIAISLN